MSRKWVCMARTNGGPWEPVEVDESRDYIRSLVDELCRHGAQAGEMEVVV